MEQKNERFMGIFKVFSQAMCEALILVFKDANHSQNTVENIYSMNSKKNRRKRLAFQINFWHFCFQKCNHQTVGKKSRITRSWKKFKVKPKKTNLGVNNF